MIELFEKDIYLKHQHSSKGNQLKWRQKDQWYKADYTGYEGMSEYLVSHLLQKTDLVGERFILYQTEELCYRHSIYRGCSSGNFLKKNWSMITLERLFQTVYGQSLNKCIYTISDVKERIRFLVEQTVQITGLQEFGKYMSILLTVDAVFLNEDRHTHNIAVLMDENGNYRYCPLFDHGGTLLSDTTIDYPMNIEVEKLVQEVEAKTFCRDFDEQLDRIEELYGSQIRFHFTNQDIDQLIEQELYYPADVKERVKKILVNQRRKYQYLFGVS